MCIVVESLCCTPKTDITLYVNDTPIKTIGIIKIDTKKILTRIQPHLNEWTITCLESRLSSDSHFRTAAWAEVSVFFFLFVLRPCQNNSVEIKWGFDSQGHR